MTSTNQSLRPATLLSIPNMDTVKSLNTHSVSPIIKYAATVTHNTWPICPVVMSSSCHWLTKVFVGLVGQVGSHNRLDGCQWWKNMTHYVLLGFLKWYKSSWACFPCNLTYILTYISADFIIANHSKQKVKASTKADKALYYETGQNPGLRSSYCNISPH